MSEVTAVPLRPVNKVGITTLWVGVAGLLAIGGATAWAASQEAAMTAMPAAQFMAANAHRMGVQVLPSGIQYQVLKAGAGVAATMSDVAVVDYKGKLSNGTEFDASKPGQPVPMPLQMVVPGFAEGLTHMAPGGTYRLWIPPQLGYGDHDKGPIPANSVLVFDITVHQVIGGQQFMQMMQAQQAQQQPQM